MTEPATKRRGRGRPPKAPGTQLVDIGVRLEPDLLKEIKAIAESQGPSQSELIREMLAEGVARRRAKQVRAA